MQVAIMEKLRKDGIVVETLQISNFLAHNRKTEGSELVGPPIVLFSS